MKGNMTTPLFRKTSTTIFPLEHKLHNNHLDFHFKKQKSPASKNLLSLFVCEPDRSSFADP